MFSLINFQDHPTNKYMKVFYFRQVEHANYFEQLLKERQVNYEKQVDEEGDQTIYYGVKLTDFKEAKEINYLTIGKFRKPFIPDLFFRYLLIAVSVFILALAIIGAIVSST